MAKNRAVRACSICGSEKECIPVTFIPVQGQDRVNVKPYTGVREITYPNEVYLYACDACGQEKGSSPKKAWIAVLAGYVLVALGIGICASVAPSNGSANFLGIFVVFIGWLTAMIAGSILVFKTRHENGAGGLLLPFFLQFFPGLGLLALAAQAKKINRGARAVTALKTVAEARRREEREKDEAIQRRMESGAPLTEEEQKEIEERKKEKEAAQQQAEYARAEQAEKANTSNMRWAIFGIIFTVIIGIYGAGVYSSGRGYMTLFRTIELSPGGFAAVIAALILWDVIALVRALKNRK